MKLRILAAVGVLDRPGDLIDDGGNIFLLERGDRKTFRGDVHQLAVFQIDDVLGG